MLSIYLARHGQDEDNAAGILNGRRDTPLTEKGRTQASECGALIRDRALHFDAVYTSPLVRTRQTAEIIAEISYNPTPRVLDVLIERDFGVMTGVPTARVAELCSPDILQSNTITYFLNPAGAETFPDLIARAQLVFREVQRLHTDGSILLVTHGDFGKMLYAAYYNLPWQDVLQQFHFGNSELLQLSSDSPAELAHVFQIAQHNV
jgi:broad specificity phosphatase PhoE